MNKSQVKNAQNKINHKEIVEMVCRETGSSKTVVKSHIDCYINAIMQKMCEGYNVGVRHLGVFKVEETAMKTAWDFKKKSKVTRPARVLPKMSFSREFSNKVKVSNEK